ncbi:MAG TPA: ABC transporter, partial [bacterium]
ILVSPVNFLIMDEPTNHLDPGSRQALEEALAGYDGTLLVISHDRYFLDKLVRKIVEVKNGALSEMEGNYSDYLARREAEYGGSSVDASQPGGKSAARLEREERKTSKREMNRILRDIEATERSIGRLERRKADIEVRLAEPGTYQDAGKAATLHKEYLAVQNELNWLMEQWEAAQSTLVSREQDTN